MPKKTKKKTRCGPVHNLVGTLQGNVILPSRLEMAISMTESALYGFSNYLSVNIYNIISLFRSVVPKLGAMAPAY